MHSGGCKGQHPLRPSTPQGLGVILAAWGKGQGPHLITGTPGWGGKETTVRCVCVSRLLRQLLSLGWGQRLKAVSPFRVQSAAQY